jgi:phospholipase/carboxylesterase
VLSGTLPFDAGVPTTASSLKDLPVFFSQGASDTVIPLELQQRSARYLANESRAKLTISIDEGGHSISAIALQRLSAWVSDLVSLDAATTN